MLYLGIDYGATTGANRDSETGIRYGVISQNSVLQAWADSAEADYGEPACPHCGNPVVEYNDDAHGEYDGDCAEYACESCRRTYDTSECYGEEPIGWSYDYDEYTLTDCLDTDIFVLKSPYYTFAAYCSPCVPGAGNLDSPHPDGVPTYCLGHDWFEDGVAPYPVYSVETHELIPAPSKE